MTPPPIRSTPSAEIREHYKDSYNSHKFTMNLGIVQWTGQPDPKMWAAAGGEKKIFLKHADVETLRETFFLTEEEAARVVKAIAWGWKVVRYGKWRGLLREGGKYVLGFLVVVDAEAVGEKCFSVWPGFTKMSGCEVECKEDESGRAVCFELDKEMVGGREAYLKVCRARLRERLGNL